MDFLFQAALAEGTEQQPNYMTDTVFKKLMQADAKFWGMIIGLAALALIFFLICRNRKFWTAQTVAYGAISIALSFVLSYIRVFRMPQGGSITPASMLPLMLFSAAYGVGPGMAAGLVYGVLQYFQGGDFLSVWQVIFDYLIAFAALGLAGLYRYLHQKWQIFLTMGLSAALLVLMLVSYPGTWWIYAILLAALVVLAVFVLMNPEKFSMLPAMGIAVLGRAVSAVIAGLMWVPYSLSEGWITAEQANAPLLYSLVYNGAYLVPELVICMVVAGMVGTRLLQAMKQR